QSIFWKDARDVAGNAAAGDVGEAFHGNRFEEREDRLDVDARGLEEIERRPRVALQDFADEGVAVGMRAARGDAEDGVAGGDGAAVEDALFLHHADAEPGEV